MSNKLFKYYKEFNESIAYDEPVTPPTASIRQEDWSTKDMLDQISNLSYELSMYIEDGEQLEKSQRDTIKNIFDNLNSLKRKAEGREEVKQKEEESQLDKIDNPNL